MKKLKPIFYGYICFTIMLSSMLFAVPQKKNIIIIATGGTIAGASKSTTSTAYKPASLDIDSLISTIPDLARIANIQGEQLVQIASQEMNDDIWLKLAKRVNQMANDPKIDGIVITHGTDTMEETAYFLNLVLKTRKPVVLVGSMRPATALSADGPLNLFKAVLVASSELAFNNGVLILLNDEIHQARYATKYNTTKTNSFISPNTGPLGHVVGEVLHFYQKPLKIHTIKSIFDISHLNELPKVDIVYSYANADGITVKALVENKAKGIIVAGTGNGNPSPSLMEYLIDARKKGVHVVRSSRCGSGITTKASEVDDQKQRFISANSLNPQKSRVLLMLALTKTNNWQEIQKYFDTY
ncbi:type II asparaginase [Candidatus Margulisiibacteriota bacterium]